MEDNSIACCYMQLTVEEMEQVANTIREHEHVTLDDDKAFFKLRFLTISVKEPAKLDIVKVKSGLVAPNSILRQAEVVTLNPRTGIGSEFLVDVATMSIIKAKQLPLGVQPMFSFCEIIHVEKWIKTNDVVKAALKDRYGIDDINKVVFDPWSITMASEEDVGLMNWRSNPEYNTDPTLPTDVPGRLVQCFMYHRQHGKGMEDNHYAHPIDIVPIVDLNAMVLIRIEGMDRLPAPKIPSASCQYNRDVLYLNSYLETKWREDTLQKLDITQPDGPSFTVSKDNVVDWQKWKFTVGFNYREGIVLYDISFDGRPIIDRAALVEMTIPYADSTKHGRRKCAFDVGDYGMGYCANSLELGCDCLGHIHYFDAFLPDANGKPITKKKAICMHEEDQGILWKHVEFRNGHNESRRSRELVISSIATVVNYEYAMYWRFKQDGSIEFNVKLTGMLSTNSLSAEEEIAGSPNHGLIVAPGVNAQVHQHMFCCRLDITVDGVDNIVSEVDVVPVPLDPVKNPWGNAFVPVETVLKTELDAIRTADSTKARVWKISSATKKNPINGKPTAYKLIPYTRGPAQPIMLTDGACVASKRAAYAKANLWVTPYMQNERFPAGEYTSQTTGYGGLPIWTKKNRSLVGQSNGLVLWHSFGVVHVPRIEDFPVMPCEVTGFTLKPDNFFSGNPATDLPPEKNCASRLACGCSEQ
jgi:primary-amine oxidase